MEENGLLLDKEGLSVMKSLYDRPYYEVPEGVKIINHHTFAFTSQLTYIDLPDSLEELGDEVFSNACSLENLDLPYGIKKVGYKLCFNCKSLTNVTVPESLEKLGSQMFSGCENLRFIVLGSFSVNHMIEVEPADVEGVPVDSCVLFVVKHLMEKYRQHPVWGKFKNIRDMDELL